MACVNQGLALLSFCVFLFAAISTPTLAHTHASKWFSSTHAHIPTESDTNALGVVIIEQGTHTLSHIDTCRYLIELNTHCNSVYTTLTINVSRPRSLLQISSSKMDPSTGAPPSSLAGTEKISNGLVTFRQIVLGKDGIWVCGRSSFLGDDHNESEDVTTKRKNYRVVVFL